MKVTKNYIFFWGGSILSNWAETPLILPDINVTVPTSEHYFMYLKAMYFKDTETAEKILKSKTPRDAKKLGREVKNFSEELWEKERENAMLTALRLKFKQNLEFRKMILAAKSSKVDFAEASPHDSIWGIGMGENHPNLLNTSLWGLNLLGKCLNTIKDEAVLKESEE